MGQFLKFFLIGLCGIAVLGLVGIHWTGGARDFEAMMKGQSQAKLASLKLGSWLSLRVDGRDAYLEGTALLKTQKAAAITKAGPALNAIRGIREVNDRTAYHYVSTTELYKTIGLQCASAVKKSGAEWLKCTVEKQTVTLSGTALTEPRRKRSAESVKTLVEKNVKGGKLLKIVFKAHTRAHYTTDSDMLAKFAKQCAAILGKIPGNWLACGAKGQTLTLSGMASLETERKSAVVSARATLKGLPGLKKIDDKTTARYPNAEAMKAALSKACSNIIARQKQDWINCSVKGSAITLTGTALTETKRKETVAAISKPMAALPGVTVTDRTKSKYADDRAMRRELGQRCLKLAGAFPANWMGCNIVGRDIILTGEAPIDRERKARVTAIQAKLTKLPGGGKVIDKTTAAPEISTADACQKLVDVIKEGKSILFDTGRAAIKSDSYKLLNSLAFAVKRCPTLNVEIHGHTDKQGEDEANQKLSKLRAAAVSAYLAKVGVVKKRLTQVGHGAEDPIGDNETAEGRAKNRRIEFKIKQ